MHIILVSDRLAKARSLELSLRHLVLTVLTLAAAVVCLSFALSYFGVRHAAHIKLPLLQSLVLSANQDEARKSDDFMRENLNAMAVKLGEMQAQLLRLDALGERLSTMAGVKPGEFRFRELPGRGGALPTSVPPRDLSFGEFTHLLEITSNQMENHTDLYGILESQLLDARLKQRQMPTTLPVAGTWNASGFGYRLDPISGQAALHEGIDFIADTGTPIHAAAAGVVAFADFHHSYGYVIDIDHGGELVTRYAHTSRMLVKPGEMVRRGQKIAEVGSTGRSTGSHLHFEVRIKGIAQNPTRFLNPGPAQQASAR